MKESCLVVMKGAPEKILERCETIYMNKETKPLHSTLRNMCDRACWELASKGNPMAKI